MQNIADLNAGHEFSPARHTLRPQDVARYLEAAGDQNALFHADGYVPPTALAAYALGGVLSEIDLPPGAIHSAQELTVSRPVASNEDVVFRARLSRNTTMRGMRFLYIDFTGEDADSQRVINGRSVVVVPGEREEGVGQ